MMSEVKYWKVEYDHKDGRKGIVDVKTEVTESKAFKYGNGKAGFLTVDGYTQQLDLRYINEKDLHMVMLQNYFEDGLVTAIEC